MHKEIPESLTPEQLKQQEDEARYSQWIKDHPAAIAPETLRECESEIEEFEGMINLFESEYSLEELHSIVDLKPEEAPRYPVRESAKVALYPILTKLHILKDETNISPEKYTALEVQWKKIFNAVGIINNNKVDHGR